MKEDKETILLIDDEPHCLTWLIEYFESQAYTVRIARDLSMALTYLAQKRYRLVVCDLGIPVHSHIKAELDASGPEYIHYPGLLAAHQARNIGHRARQVVVYSVHDSPAVREIASKIRVTYITKGRPKIFKAEIDDILQYDPTKAKKS